MNNCQLVTLLIHSNQRHNIHTNSKAKELTCQKCVAIKSIHCHLLCQFSNQCHVSEITSAFLGNKLTAYLKITT